MRKAFDSLLAAACMLTLSGCASIPHRFYAPQAARQPGDAIVYLYRPKGEQIGSSRTYTIYLNRTNVVTIRHGSYFPLEVSPGPFEVVCNPNKGTNEDSRYVQTALLPTPAEEMFTKEERLIVNAQPGGEYFVRFRPEPHFSYFKPRFDSVLADEAKREISNCELIIRP